jgi:hypothetical protein
MLPAWGSQTLGYLDERKRVELTMVALESEAIDTDVDVSIV